MTAKRKPKVRYVANLDGGAWRVHFVGEFVAIATCGRRVDAKRIAAALNLYEARRRGELT